MNKRVYCMGVQHKDKSARAFNARTKSTRIATRFRQKLRQLTRFTNPVVGWASRRKFILSLVVWYSFMWSWSFFTDSLKLAGSKTQGLALATVVVLINVLLAVLIMWQFIRLLAFIHQRLGLKVLLVLGVPVMALAEYAVAWLVALIWLGPQGSIDNVLPMGSVGLPVVITPFRFAARIVGLYGLGGFVWLLLYLARRKRTRKASLWPIGALAIISLIGFVAYRTNTGVNLRAELISERLSARVPVVTPENVDLVVFPEYGLDKITNENLSTRIVGLGDKPTYFVGSEQVFRNRTTGHLNRMLFGNTRDGMLEAQDKYRLIPGGEDLPYVVRSGLRALGQQSTISYFDYARSVLKGENQLLPFVIGDDIRVASAVCSSIIAPQDYRDFARSGANIFTNSASLATFKGSPLFAWQQKTLGKFMAVSNARYFLQSANAASAYAIDINGNQYAQVSGITTVVVEARTNQVETLYTRFGEWLVSLGFVITVCLVLFFGTRRLIPIVLRARPSKLAK